METLGTKYWTLGVMQINKNLTCFSLSYYRIFPVRENTWSIGVTYV